MIVPSVLERCDHLGVTAHRRENAKLKLAVVDIDEQAALRGAEEATELRIGRDVLQIRIRAGVAPGHCAAGMQLSVEAAIDDMLGEARPEGGETARDFRRGRTSASTMFCSAG